MNIIQLWQSNYYYSLEEFQKITSEHHIDIHQKDDLLLYHASLKRNISIVLYLLENGANPLSHDGKWLSHIFNSLSEEHKNYYFYLILNNISPQKFNLFHLADTFDYFKILVDNDYPMPFLCMRKLSFEQYQYLKQINKLDYYCENAYQNKGLFYDFFGFFEDEIETYYLIRGGQVNEFYEYFKLFEVWPYCLDDKTQIILEKKEYYKLDIKHIIHNSSMVDDLVKDYPDYFDYWINHANPGCWLREKFDTLKKILHAQNATAFHDDNARLFPSNKEKMAFILSHVKLSIELILRIVNFFKFDLSDALSIFDEKEDKHILNQFLYLLQTTLLSHAGAQEAIEIIHTKMNQKQINIDLIKASQEGNVELVKSLVRGGADIHCEQDICLYYAYEANHVELIEYLYPLSFLNQENFELALKSENFSIISFYLNSDTCFDLYSLFNCQNDHLCRLIINQFSEKMTTLLVNSPETIYFKHNLIFQSFFINYLEQCIHFEHISYLVESIIINTHDEALIVQCLKLYLSKFNALDEKYLYIKKHYQFMDVIGHHLFNNNLIHAFDTCIKQNILSFEDTSFSFWVSRLPLSSIKHFYSIALFYNKHMKTLLKECLFWGDTQYLSSSIDSLLIIEKMILSIDLDKYDYDILKPSLIALFELFIQQHNNQTDKLEKVLYLHLNKVSYFLLNLIAIFKEKEKLNYILNDEVVIKKTSKV